MLAPWPHFDDEQVEAAAAVLRSGRVNHWTGGECRAFEAEYAAWCGTAHAIALANGSLALSAALLAVGVGRGDEVITTPRTFVATASAPVLLGARPVFADVDPDSQAITATTIEPLITPRTKAIVVVHLGGWPADMPAICALAQAHGLAVIEDCAQAHGAALLVDGQWRSVGSFGAVGAWSFCQDKIMSTGGEGGMVTTNSPELWRQMWSFKDHGKDPELAMAPSDPRRKDFRWLHSGFGSNFRLTEPQAAIGRIQLRRLEQWQQLRAGNAQILIDAIADHPAVRVPVPPAQLRHAWYKFYAFVRLEALAADWSRQRILEELSDLEVPAYSGSCGEVYLEESFRNAGLVPERPLPIAHWLGTTSLMLLVHPTITPEQMAQMAERVKAVLDRAVR
ncbi:MAG: DegT/DnrJ/EryC1/StrS aminotransferase family protein [Cyanobacteriota bacterium]|nr:DegT/DnrJ/EryC1/StrS aminotransferase family protein [Cyanobacteriota bacterium]